ncbi:hypothetical protein PS15p_201702 [Mucor circinelloides]
MNTTLEGCPIFTVIGLTAAVCVRAPNAFIGPLLSKKRREGEIRPEESNKASTKKKIREWPHCNWYEFKNLSATGFFGRGFCYILFLSKT